MDKKREPDPRFNEFTQELDSDGKAIGFKIPNNDFLFKFDSVGGWVDQDGYYYNHEGILQSDSEDEDDDEQSYSDRDDDLIDEFQDMLRREEEGTTRNTSHKQSSKKEEEALKVEEASEKVEPVQQNKEFDFKGVIERYKNKEHIRQDLPGELFIYFKQKGDFFEEIKPSVQNKQNIEEKNKQIEGIQKGVQAKRQALIKDDPWLQEDGVSLQFSGESEEESIYDRYWYGSIKTTAEKYLDLLEAIGKSQQFNLLTYKTFYALKSKFYLKKAEEKVRKHIGQIKEKVESMKEDEVIVMKLDNLPENYPLSFVYDLVHFVGGSASDIEEAHAIDEFKAVVHVCRQTALKMANLEAYNHDKGQFVELEVEEKKPRKSNPEKRFYWIEVEGDYKQHQRQLCDTLALLLSRQGLAKQMNLEQYKKSHVRFAVGSAQALKKVLMFRGPSLNTLHIWPTEASK